MTAKADRPRVALPKGMRDIDPREMRGVGRMMAQIAALYERYGFDPLDTPAIEFTEALGKFLPDLDRPNEGVFSFRDEDDAWLSLRYDLTAPLARYVAANAQSLPTPFRRYQYGPVWRNEKPGPGRFRQFLQFDADTVGTDNPAADAELCMMAADALEAVGVARGTYVIKVSSRRLLDRVMDEAGVAAGAQRLVVLRAVDKLDRLGIAGVRDLLGAGRRDDSGDYTAGAQLAAPQIASLERFLSGDAEPDDDVTRIEQQCRAAGYGADRVAVDPTVVRGLEYYTGAVFEADLTGAVGAPRFGSVGGGGRYDGLVERFTGQRVPATGFSIGVSRLYAALQALGAADEQHAAGPVVVLVMDKARIAEHQRLTAELRAAGIRAELYLGTAGMKAQMKYADRRAAPLVVIEGGDEVAAGTVTLKDMAAGRAAAAGITERETWREARPAQHTVARGEIVPTVQRLLAAI